MDEKNIHSQTVLDARDLWCFSVRWCQRVSERILNEKNATIRFAQNHKARIKCWIHAKSADCTPARVDVERRSSSHDMRTARKRFPWKIWIRISLRINTAMEKINTRFKTIFVYFVECIAYVTAAENEDESNVSYYSSWKLCFRMQLPNGNNGKLLQIAAVAAHRDTLVKLSLDRAHHASCMHDGRRGAEGSIQWEWNVSKCGRKLNLCFQQKRNERKSQ